MCECAGINSIVICIQVKGKPNKERVTLKPGENDNGKMWINIYNNRQTSAKGYPIDNNIKLLFP